jgi:hypothetical protein
MNDDADNHDCLEPYRECVRSRQERIRQAIELNPGLTSREVADIAGVSQTAVINNKRKTENPFSTQKPLKLRDLYDVKAKVEINFQPDVAGVERALQRCSRAQLAFLFDVVWPAYAKDLLSWAEGERRRKQNVNSTDGATQEDRVANAG